MKGMFIVFEGLDGSGKTTQLEKLSAWLKRRGVSLWCTKEPTKGEPYGAKIGRILHHEEAAPAPSELQTLYLKDRKTHSREIEAHLENGGWVICDRYWYSTVAYGVAEGLSFEKWVEKNKHFLVPDLALYFDVPAEEAMRRIEKRGESRRYFEKLEKLEKVREVYLRLVEVRKEFHLIDGTLSPSLVFQKVLKLIKSLS
jgi:dTMP kinase